MARIPEPIQKIVEDYIKKIGSQISIDKAIVFGSYAKNTYNKDSDIDLAIFSNDFANMEDIEAFKYLFMQTLEYDVDFQPMAFTVNDYINPLGIVEDIINTGIEVTM